jgi:hypothetical protein
MAKHDVWFDIPVRRLGKTDLNFYVKIDGETFGQLSISNGAIVWFPKSSKNGLKVSWRKFEEMMRENSGRSKRRK